MSSVRRHNETDAVALKRLKRHLGLLLACSMTISFLAGFGIAKIDFDYALVALGGFLLVAIGSLAMLTPQIRPLEARLKSVRNLVLDAGHELSTPMSVALTKLQLLDRQQSMSMPIASIDFEALNDIIRRMSVIIEDLRLLVAIGGSTNQWDLSIVELDQVVRQVTSALAEKFEQRKMTVDLRLVEPITLVAAGDALNRLLTNLLSNSVRYGRENGTVVIKAHKDRNDIELSVSDDGPGIPQDALPQIFDRFYRVDPERSRKLGGCGLGLAIVQSIVDWHAGEISVHSEVGKGVTFTIKMKDVPKRHPALQ